MDADQKVHRPGPKAANLAGFPGQVLPLAPDGKSISPCKSTAFSRGTVVACQAFVNASLFHAGADLTANGRWQEIISDPVNPS
jgi:hypothetical protein